MTNVKTSEHISIPPKMFLGLSNTSQELDPSNPCLGFVAPEGTDSGAKKRKETIENWVIGVMSRNLNQSKSSYNAEEYRSTRSQAQAIYKPIVFDNVPTSGFQIEKVVSRYRTDNKVFRMIDPRGFVFDIAASNLAELIEICDISKGAIQTPCVYGRVQGINWLTAITHPQYTDDSLFAPVEGPLVPGEWYMDSNRRVRKFLGRYHIVLINHYGGTREKAFGYWSSRRTETEIIPWLDQPSFAHVYLAKNAWNEWELESTVSRPKKVFSPMATDLKELPTLAPEKIEFKLDGSVVYPVQPINVTYSSMVMFTSMGAARQWYDRFIALPQSRQDAIGQSIGSHYGKLSYQDRDRVDNSYDISTLIASEN